MPSACLLGHVGVALVALLVLLQPAVEVHDVLVREAQVALGGLQLALVLVGVALVQVQLGERALELSIEVLVLLPQHLRLALRLLQLRGVDGRAAVVPLPAAALWLLWLGILASGGRRHAGQDGVELRRPLQDGLALARCTRVPHYE